MTGLVIIAAVLLQEGRLRRSLARGLRSLKGAMEMRTRYLLPVLTPGAAGGLWRRREQCRRDWRAGAARRGAAARGKAFWRIGFSQATTTEPWRVVFNDRLKAEAAKHPEVELILQDANDKTDLQVQQTRNLITQQVNALLISPKESAGLTGVVAEAYDAGIPVFVLDRNVEGGSTTSFIGADNVEIGRQAGQYAAKLLGGPGKAKGTYVEVWGGFATKPSKDRSDGFHEVVDRSPG